MKKMKRVEKNEEKVTKFYFDVNVKVINQIFESRNLIERLDEIWESDEIQKEIRRIQEFMIGQLEENEIDFTNSYLNVVLDDNSLSEELDFWIKHQIIGRTIAEMLRSEEDSLTKGLQKNITVKILKEAVKTFETMLTNEIKKSRKNVVVVN